MTGDDVRKLRERLGLTQEELGRRLARNGVAVCRWETGVHPVPATAARAMADLAAARQPEAQGPAS